MSLSICIATYERVSMLRKTLEALAVQTSLPEEIVVSDASAGTDTESYVEEFRQSHTNLTVRYYKSTRKALPWQRWWAFSHSKGDVILFMDDDILLAPGAVEELLNTYKRLESDKQEMPVAGLGFIISYENMIPGVRSKVSLRERWLKTASCRPGTVTAAGLTVSHLISKSPFPEKVDWLSGGAMSFRRDTIEAVGQLDGLISLYERGFGKGEDAVLSVSIRKYGNLYTIPGSFAFHQTAGGQITRANPGAGWKRSMWGTWGRAHTMRWIATDYHACRRKWFRLASLEFIRAVRVFLCAPWRMEGWARFVGNIYGTIKSLLLWNRIPSHPKS